MDIDLFAAFESGEGVDEVAPPSAAAEESRKRLLESDIGVAVESKFKKTDEDERNAVSSGKVVHTEERKIEWSGRTVLTSSALPEGFPDLSGEKDMNTMPKNPAKTYPFELDPFQKQSIAYIERNESVLVAAHTSAGKTVVAEYAVARSIKKGQRVIYTSPIKALSNQKFRDMQEEFGNDAVGLMTGDITINPTATCLIMTTEILRSMLYRGSEVMREVAWVIYDEIHYMRDKERGVVWEESIILLPHKVRFVFLSATIPNAREFVGWIAGLHHQPCHVVYTDYRPTPLQHYIFPAGGEGLHLVVDDKGVFREDAFQHAMAKLQANTKDEAIVLGDNSKKRKKQQSAKDGPTDLGKIINLVMDRDFDPVIVFSFAKKECETYAMQMNKKDFNTEDEKELVTEVFNNAIDALSDDDKTLPQVESLLPILRRGIGIHHGGLLPILKEVIEILFQEGLLKVLFATETFSIGLNMPAHTVVFTASRKFDGKDFRWITAGEYIQMAGRAGRRGKDTNGIVIQMMDEKMEPTVAKDILYGQPDELYSSYHVSYNMLLNMMRVEGADPTFLVKSSFHQYQQEKGAPALEQQADELSEERDNIIVKDEESVKNYHTIYDQLNRIHAEIRAVKMLPENVVAFLQAGRLVHIAYTNEKDEVLDFGWGAVVDFKASKKSVNGYPTDPILEVILSCNAEETTPTPYSASSALSDGSGGGGGEATSEMRVVKVSLKSLKDLSTLRIFLPKDLKSLDSRQSVSKTLGEVSRRIGVIPSLDPVTDMKVLGVSTLMEKKSNLEERLEAHPFHTAIDKAIRLADYTKKHELGEKVKLLRKTSKQAQAPVMRDVMRRMQRVLKKLGHVKADGVIDTKGRVACEVNTADELVVTELVFGGMFVSLGDAETCALLSCLVFGERRKDDAGAPKLKENLAAPFRQLQDTIRQIANVCIECKMELEVEEYLAGFNPDLMEVVFGWAGGAKFIDIIKLTTCYEGTVIRVIRRLEELLRQLASASFVIGNNVLKEKFERCAASMRRDIVFAASLYL